MSSGAGGLGTSGQTFNANGNTNSFSQSSPYGPAQPGIQSIINEVMAAGQAPGQPLSAGGALPQQDKQNYDQAMSNIGMLPNFGPAAAQTASNILQTGGDPLGILRRESGQIGYGADSPGMRDVLKTIQGDVSNQINGQFAGAGRSLSGLNQQTLARGLSQGEAVPLLNQYNQNIANQMGIQGAAMGNIGQGMNYAQMAPGLAQQGPMAQESLLQQKNLQPLNYLSAYENMLNPMAGLGGTVQGNQQTSQAGTGTATNSILSQLGQGAGLINPFGGLLGTLFG